jgi:hypothetical protein
MREDFTPHENAGIYGAFGENADYFPLSTLSSQLSPLQASRASARIPYCNRTASIKLAGMTQISGSSLMRT